MIFKKQPFALASVQLDRFFFQGAWLIKDMSKYKESFFMVCQWVAYMTILKFT